MRIFLLISLLLFGGNAMSLDLNAYKEGFREGWSAHFYEKGRAVPNPPAVSNPPAKRSGDKRTDRERGYMKGLTEAATR